MVACSPSAVSTAAWSRLWTALASDESFARSFGRKAWKFDGCFDFAAGAFTMDDLEARAAEYPSVFGAHAVKYNDAYLMKSFNPSVRASGRPGSWALDLPEEEEGRTIEADAVSTALQESTVVLNSAGFFIAPLAQISLSMIDALGLPVWLNSTLTARRPWPAIAPPPWRVRLRAMRRPLCPLTQFLAHTAP